MTETLYTVAALLAVVGSVAWIAARVRLPPPILLVLAGMALAVVERLSIPRRITAVLEGEGLVNDATALILFNLALTAVLTGRFSIADAARDFALVLVGETAWGLLVGYVILRLRHFAADPRI